LFPSFVHLISNGNSRKMASMRNKDINKSWWDATHVFLGVALITVRESLSREYWTKIPQSEK